VATWRTAGTRAKHSDRNNTCQILDNALAEGQLSMEEHRHRVAAATKAATLGELQGLVTDLQVVNAPVMSPSKRPRGGGWWLKAAAVGVLVSVGIAVGWGLYDDTSSPTSDPDANASSPADETSVLAETSVPPAKADDPGADPDGVAPEVLTLPRQLHTVGGLTGLLEQMRKRFGDTTGIELAITPDEAMLFRPDPTDDQTKLLYRFHGGWGDPTRKPRDDKDIPADLGAFDVKAIAEVLRGAPETLGINPADVSEVFVDIDNIQDPTGVGALELLVKVDAKSGGSGYIYLDSAGNTKRVEYPS